MRDKVFFFVDWWYFYRWVKRIKAENINLKNICEKIAWNREIVWIGYYVWIIITWDWDFQPAVKLIQDKLWKIILNWSFKWHFAKILMDTCTRFFFIDDKVKT